MNVGADSIDRLYETIFRLESKEECCQFFEDLCTIKELQDMAQRLDTAILLYEGNSYQSISQRSSVSTATIGRVNRCLQYGAGGYQRVIEKLKKAEG